MKIKIVDSIMGSAKTTKLIQQMNEDKNNKYIYITPFLSEVERVKNECVDRRFYEPRNYGHGKLENLHNMLEKGYNICSTHALFKISNDVTRELIEVNDYILVLDEVLCIVEQLIIKKDDVKMLLDNELIFIENDGLVRWNKNKLNFDSRFNDIKQMALNKNLYIINDVVLIWSFPADIFKKFKEVFVLTYLFEGQLQKYYYDIFGIEYEYYHVEGNWKDGFKLIKGKNDDSKIKKELKGKIHILEDKINKIGDNRYALSVSWFEKEENKRLIGVLKNHIGNYFKNKVKAKSNELIWTTYKEFKGKLKGRGYTKGFIVLNTRATNEYRDKKYLAYCCNIFLKPVIKRFFELKGVRVNQELYALSEMLQWIWRSGIREGKEIWVYVPSKRMRDLLVNWLEGKV